MHGQECSLIPPLFFRPPFRYLPYFSFTIFLNFSIPLFLLTLSSLTEKETTFIDYEFMEHYIEL